MELAGVTVALVVRSEWCELRHVRRFLELSDAPAAEDHGSRLMYARVLETDPHGLWIQLGTARHRANPNVELVDCFVPWAAVASVFVLPQHRDAHAEEEFKRLLGVAPPATAP